MRIDRDQRFCDVVRQIDGDEETLIGHEIKLSCRAKAEGSRGSYLKGRATGSLGFGSG